MAYLPQTIRLTAEDKVRIKSLAQQQTIAYGHDRGFFTLGRKDSSHEIGFEGEIGFLRWGKDFLQLNEPADIGLNQLGAEFDAYIYANGIRHNIHIKTGRWSSWPREEFYFGVHYGQNLETSGCPIVLVSYLRDNVDVVRIEGYMPSEVLARQKIIRRGECFPGMRYPSRTDNWLTRFGDYEPICGLMDFLSNRNNL